MKIMTVSQSLNKTIEEEMLKDKSIVVLGEDIGIHGGIYNVTESLLNKFGEKRIKDTPISESIIIGTGLGSALTGLRPIVEIMYMDFTGVCMDQIINQVAKIHYMTGGRAKVPMVIRTQCGAGTGEAAQHSQCLESIFSYIPGIKVVMPSTPYNAKGLLKSAIRDDNPVMFIEHKLIYYRKGEVPEQEYVIPLGKADIKRKGKDITIVTYSNMLYEVLEAAKILAEKGIDAEIIDLQSIMPMDIDTILESVKKTGKIIIAHEGYKEYGVGAEVVRQVIARGFDYLDASPQVIGSKRSPIPYNRTLEKDIVPTSNDIIECVEKELGKI